MSQKRQRAAETGTERRPTKKYWESLSWDDLTDWAGERSVSRGKTYQRLGRVHDLTASEDVRLLASVIGGNRYTVTAWCESDRKKVGGLHSRCTCPVGANGCKHAVAVVAAYLELLGKNADVPPVDPEDPRWAMLANDDPDANADAIDADEEEEARGKFSSRAKGDISKYRMKDTKAH
jgi:uncharacterized Zn finger protein